MGSTTSVWRRFGLKWVGCLLLVAAVVGCSRRVPSRPGAASASGQTPPVASGTAPAVVSADELKDLLRRVGAGVGGAGQAAPVRVAELEAMAQRAAPAERALIERMIRLVRAFDPLGGVPRPEALLEFFQEYAAILRGVGDLYLSDVPTQLMVAATLGTLPAMMRSLELQDSAAEAAFQTEASQRAESLLLRFPQVADVHALRASLCEHAAGEPLACLRHWARCFELEPTNRCAAEYARRARDYAVPFCAGPNIRPELSFRGVHGTAVDAAPSFRSADLLSISVSTTQVVIIGEPMSDADAQPRAISVRLKPERAAAFETWTASLAADRGAIVLLRGTKLLSRAQVRTALKGSFELAGIELDELCATIERKALPAELPAPP